MMTLDKLLSHIKQRNTAYLLSSILLLALALRITAMWSLKKTIYFDFLLWDEQVYHSLAGKIADGTYNSTSVYEFPPLPAYLMAFIYKLIAPDVVYIRLLYVILGTATCYNIYRIGEGLSGRNIGLAACLITALYEPFVFYSIVPLKTTLALFLFSLMVSLCVRTMNKPSVFSLLLLGLSAGLVLNIRPNSLVVLPFLPLFIIWTQTKKSVLSGLTIKVLAVFALGFVIAVAPFVVRNYRVAGVVAMTTTQSGQNLYCGNNLISKEPYYRPLSFAVSSPFLQGIQFTIEAGKRTGKKLTHVESSNYWTRQVFSDALNHPDVFFMRMLRKVLAIFHHFEAGDHYHVGFIQENTSFIKLPLLQFWMIIPFGMAGLMVSIFSSKKAFALDFLLIIYSATLVLFYVNTRLRLPMLTIFIPLSVIGIHRFYSFIRNKEIKKCVVYGTVFCTFLVIGFLPVYGTDDLTAYYNTHALILNSKGRQQEAIKYWEQSSKMNKPFSAFANLSLAVLNVKKQEYHKAIDYLMKIPDNSFAAADKYTVLGDIFVKVGKYKKAVLGYSHSLKINSGQRAVRGKLIRIYRKIDPQKAAQETQKLNYIQSYYDLM